MQPVHHCTVAVKHFFPATVSTNLLFFEKGKPIKFGIINIAYQKGKNHTAKPNLHVSKNLNRL